MKKKFSIVSYIEGDIKGEIILLQEKLYTLTGSRKCLDDRGPHITLGDGIIIEDESVHTIEYLMKSTFGKYQELSFDIQGFGGKTDRKGGVGEITTPYVLWLNVILNHNLNSIVTLIGNKVTAQFKRWYTMPLPYVPHVTVAFRDLTEEGYTIGQQFLKNQQIYFQGKINSVSLVEKTDSSNKERKRFFLNQ